MCHSLLHPPHPWPTPTMQHCLYRLLPPPELICRRCSSLYLHRLTGLIHLLYGDTNAPPHHHRIVPYRELGDRTCVHHCPSTKTNPSLVIHSHRTPPLTGLRRLLAGDTNKLSRLAATVCSTNFDDVTPPPPLPPHTGSSSPPGRWRQRDVSPRHHRDHHHHRRTSLLFFKIFF